MIFLIAFFIGYRILYGKFLLKFSKGHSKIRQERTGYAEIGERLDARSSLVQPTDRQRQDVVRSRYGCYPKVRTSKIENPFFITNIKAQTLKMRKLYEEPYHTWLNGSDGKLVNILFKVERRIDEIYEGHIF